MQIPNQDKLVFDLLDTSGTEQPLGGDEPFAQVEDEEEKVSATQFVEKEEIVELKIAPISTVVATPTVVVAEKKAEVILSAKVEPVKQVEEVKKAVTTGGWGVQLASVRAKADADAALKKLSNQFTVLRSLEGRVQSATVNGSISYRLQFVGSDNREAAAALCKTLGAKQACFPVKR
jgi:hypothetical protein